MSTALFYGSNEDLEILSNVCNDPTSLNGKIPLKDGNGLVAVSKALAAHNAMEDKLHISLMGRPGSTQPGSNRSGSRVIRALVFDVAAQELEIPNKNTFTMLWCSKAPQALASRQREAPESVAKRQEELDNRASNRVLMGEGYVAQSAGCCFVHIHGCKGRVVSGVDGEILQLLWLPKDMLPEDEKVEASLDGKFFLQPLSETEPLTAQDCAVFKSKAFSGEATGFFEWLKHFKTVLADNKHLKSTISKLLKPTEVGDTCLWELFTGIPEHNISKYRESNVEIFMPDYASFENVLSIEKPKVRDFQLYMDLYMWKKQGCVEPKNLDVDDWHAQMAKDREEAAAEEAREKEEEARKAAEKAAAKAKKDKEKAVAKAAAKEAKDKEKKEKEEKEKEKKEKEKKEKEKAEQEKAEKEKAAMEKAEKEKAKKAKTERELQAEVMRNLAAKSVPPKMPKSSRVKVITPEEKSVLYTLKKANQELNATVIPEERLAELMLTTLDMLHSCVQRGFGTEERPNKGKKDIEDAFDRLRTHGFFKSGQVDEDAWKKVFPAIWTEVVEEEEEEEKEEEKKEEKEEEKEAKSTPMVECGDELLVDDEDEEQEEEADKKGARAVASRALTREVAKAVENALTVTRVDKSHNELEEEEDKDETKGQKKKKKKDEKKKKGMPKKANEEVEGAEGGGLVKRESSKFSGHFYWYDPKTKKKYGWCEPESSSSYDDSSSDESSLGAPPPKKPSTTRTPRASQAVMMAAPSAQMMMPNHGHMMMPNQGQMMMPNHGHMMMPNQGQMMMPNQGHMMMPNQGQMMMPNHGHMMMPNQGQIMMPNQVHMMMGLSNGHMMIPQTFADFTMQDDDSRDIRRRKKKKH